jgi:hypothetical protein
LHDFNANNLNATFGSDRNSTESRCGRFSFESCLFGTRLWLDPSIEASTTSLCHSHLHPRWYRHRPRYENLVLTANKAAAQSPNIQTPPSISSTLALDQDIPQEGEAVELSATAVSHALFPITIRTRDSFLDLDLVQKISRSSTNFQCVDLDADTPPVHLSTRKCAPRFKPLRHKLDDSDSEYFHTLQPEVPYKFSSSCSIANQELVPGHRYCLSFKKEQEMKWWREGTKEEVLAAPGQELPDHMLEASGALP